MSPKCFARFALFASFCVVASATPNAVKPDTRPPKIRSAGFSFEIVDTALTTDVIPPTTLYVMMADPIAANAPEITAGLSRSHSPTDKNGDANAPIAEPISSIPDLIEGKLSTNQSAKAVIPFVPVCTSSRSGPCSSLYIFTPVPSKADFISVTSPWRLSSFVFAIRSAAPAESSISFPSSSQRFALVPRRALTALISVLLNIFLRSADFSTSPIPFVLSLSSCMIEDISRKLPLLSFTFSPS